MPDVLRFVLAFPLVLGFHRGLPERLSVISVGEEAIHGPVMINEWRWKVVSNVSDDAIGYTTVFLTVIESYSLFPSAKLR